MNEKQNILVVKLDAADENPAPVKIKFIRPGFEMKPNNNAFAVDWQMEGTGAGPENHLPAWQHNRAGGQPNGRGWPIPSFVPRRHKSNQ